MPSIIDPYGDPTLEVGQKKVVKVCLRNMKRKNKEGDAMVPSFFLWSIISWLTKDVHS